MKATVRSARRLRSVATCALAAFAIPVAALASPTPGSSPQGTRVIAGAAKASAPPTSVASFTNKSFEFDTGTTDAAGKLAARRKGLAQVYAERLGAGATAVSLEMVALPGGTFSMGSPEAEEGRTDSEGPVHTVKVAPFLLGKFEVTQAQWARVAAMPKIERDLNPSPAPVKGDLLPVNMISWADAVEFCARLSKATGRHYRLPSEAEWEYACRAGSATPFAFGPNVTPEIVNYDGNTPYQTAPVGLSRGQCVPVGSLGVANAFGLFDMHGNAWEWCADVWHDDYTGAPGDARVWAGDEAQRRRVLRGGSYKIFAAYCRSALRTGFASDFRNDFVGFRVACDAP